MTKLRVLVLSLGFRVCLSHSHLGRHGISPQRHFERIVIPIVLGTIKVLFTFSKLWRTSVDDSINWLWGAHPKFIFLLFFFFLVGLFAMSHCESGHQFCIKKSETLDIPLRGSFHSQNIIEVLHLYTL